MTAGRLVNTRDFERALGLRPWKRSAHFALHHVSERPAIAARSVPEPASGELFTGSGEVSSQAVDNLPGGCWFGLVIPKRHARRAVTRNLIRRQARSVFSSRAGALPQGLFVLRLRAPFDPGHFVSAHSQALALAVRTELESLLRPASR